MRDFSSLIGKAFERRRALVERLTAEGTDSYRLFHGISEGAPGLTIDRYGDLVLVQTFREALSESDLSHLETTLRETLNHPFEITYNHRAKNPTESFELWHRPGEEALKERQCREQGMRFLIRARHPGIDPWLFLDLRAGRRSLRRIAQGRSVLNLFAYTCGAGVAAALAGASEVWNVDFAASGLEVGARNAAINGIPPQRFRLVQDDCLPVMRQLAGLSPGGRFAAARRATKYDARSFDVVFLDPPAWAKSAFGAVDIVRDYSSLFKAAVLIARPAGGWILATNHSPSVSVEEWTKVMRRCAEKAGRPLRSLEIIFPEEDFPSFDDRPPLKVALCGV